MEKLIIKQREDSILDIDIKKFEIDFNVTLPSNFKKFITKRNGGLVENIDEVRKFLHLNKNRLSIEEVINTHQTAENNIPKGYLPIALDWSSNPITLNLNEGKEKGNIILFYLDTDSEPKVLSLTLEELIGVNNIDEL